MLLKLNKETVHLRTKYPSNVSLLSHEPNVTKILKKNQKFLASPMCKCVLKSSTGVIPVQTPKLEH